MVHLTVLLQSGKLQTIWLHDWKQINWKHMVFQTTTFVESVIFMNNISSFKWHGLWIRIRLFTDFFFIFTFRCELLILVKFLFSMLYCHLFLQIFVGETVAMLSQSDAQQSKITSIRFSCDGQKVAIGFKDGSVKVGYDLFEEEQK